MFISLKVDLHDVEQAHQSKSASSVCVTDTRLTLNDHVSHRTCVATTSKTNKHLQAAKQVCHVWARQRGLAHQSATLSTSRMAANCYIQAFSCLQPQLFLAIQLGADSVHLPTLQCHGLHDQDGGIQRQQSTQQPLTWADLSGLRASTLGACFCVMQTHMCRCCTPGHS